MYRVAITIGVAFLLNHVAEFTSAEDLLDWNAPRSALFGSPKELYAIVNLSPDVSDANVGELQAALENQFQVAGFKVKFGSQSEYYSLARNHDPHDVPQSIVVDVNFLRIENVGFVHLITISLPASGFFLHPRGDAEITIPNPHHNLQSLKLGSAVGASCRAYETRSVMARSQEWPGVIAAVVGQAREYTNAWRKANK